MARASSPRLTGRELEVATLVAEHLTNRQIAERLVLSPKTIERHMEHIFAKLGVTSRGAVARIVLRQRTQDGWSQPSADQR